MNNSTHADTPNREDERIQVTVDPSALEFYFEAVIPDVPKDIRSTMAEAIRGGQHAGERRGYDKALDLIVEWGVQWQDTHEAPFNWYGAAKALKVSKDMQLPYVELQSQTQLEKEVG